MNKMKLEVCAISVKTLRQVSMTFTGEFSFNLRFDDHVLNCIIPYDFQGVNLIRLSQFSGCLSVVRRRKSGAKTTGDLTVIERREYRLIG